MTATGAGVSSTILAVSATGAGGGAGGAGVTGRCDDTVGSGLFSTNFHTANAPAPTTTRISAITSTGFGPPCDGGATGSFSAPAFAALAFAALG